MDRNLAMEAVRVTEAAALASARLMGRGDHHGADYAAVEAMRKAFKSLAIRGTVVIGEGEKDEAPMLFIGEKVGRWLEVDPEVDIALDPLEGTNMCASGRGNALSVIAMARNGRFLHAPDTYMFKIAVGPAGKDVIDIDATPTQNLEAVADAKGIYVEDLTVVVLDRPRHIELIREIREAGARIRLIQDGDISAAIATCKDEAGVDLLMGIGGAPEGVIAAAALRCVGGDMVAKLVPQDAQSAERCRDMGINDLSRKYGIQDLAGGDVLFAATGVTNGSFLRGVRFLRGGAITHSVVMRSKSRTIRSIRAEHRFDQNPDYD
ncbi:MAG: class II fructose-bisphosphatase [Myxococcota bacterium]|nr:class II fructose-bisphosphatase [Myxococcota bacterium]